MNREFLEHYNRELKILYERSKEFAEEFPGVAERLGGLGEEQMDPGIASLLEGAAFMAARVQLKLKSEFSEFTSALLDQLLPNYLAPIPSAVLVQAEPPFEDPSLVDGKVFRARRLHRCRLCRAGAARVVPVPAARRTRAVAAQPRDGRVFCNAGAAALAGPGGGAGCRCPDCGSASGG